MKKFNDERITREYNKVAHKMYWLIMLLLLILMLIKINSDMEWKTYALELLCFGVSGIFIVISFSVKGLFFVKKPDEYSIEIQDKIYAIGFAINFCIALFGLDILFILKKADNFILWTYMAVWFIPALILTIYIIKKGLLTWGGNKQRKKTRLSLTIGVVVGTLLFEILMGANEIYKNGEFHVERLVGTLAAALFFGISMYSYLKFILNRSEKNADALVAKASVEEDNKDEKQENENSPSGM